MLLGYFSLRDHYSIFIDFFIEIQKARITTTRHWTITYTLH